jgi:voltage-gated potassium channel
MYFFNLGKLRCWLLNKKMVYKLVHSTEHLPGKVFTMVIQCLIVISLISFSLDTLPNLSPTSIKYLNYIEVFTVFVFTLEYMLRIYVAEKKWRFIFSFHGVIDLIAILPFYLASGLDLRTVRLFRLLRIVRILKLLKYSQAMHRYNRALSIAKEELILFAFISITILYLSAVGIYYFEHDAQPDQFASIFHSLWWAVTTLTTVGYGDMYPITAGGKLFTFFVLMIGLGIIAVPTGLVASALAIARQEDKDKDKGKKTEIEIETEQNENKQWTEISRVLSLIPFSLIKWSKIAPEK